jgi:hypothetical protein
VTCGRWSAGSSASAAGSVSLSTCAPRLPPTTSSFSGPWRPAKRCSGGRQGFDLGAHRVAGDDGVLRALRRRTVEAEGHAVGQRQQPLVGQQQRGVGVDQHQRLAQQRAIKPPGKHT